MEGYTLSPAGVGHPLPHPRPSRGSQSRTLQRFRVPSSSQSRLSEKKLRPETNRSAAVTATGPKVTCEGAVRSPMKVPVTGGQWEAASRRRSSGGCPGGGATGQSWRPRTGEPVAGRGPGTPGGRREECGRGRRGAGCVWQEVDRSTLLTRRRPVGAHRGPHPCQLGLEVSGVWGADVTPAPSSRPGRGPMGTGKEEMGTPKAPCPRCCLSR